MKTLLFAYSLAAVSLAVSGHRKTSAAMIPRSELELLQPTYFAGTARDADSTETAREIILPDVQDNPDIALPKYKCYYTLKNAGNWIRDARGRKYWQPAPALKVEVPCDCESIQESSRSIA
ncbi:MAG: hypothetical protein KF690_00580 [Bacteroidetes bacterium]|nr:hypothetical protein [Bacteroidota bacterium]